MESPVEYRANIQPISLPGGRSGKVGSKGVVTGWGLTEEFGLPSKLLQETSITIMDKSICGNNDTVTICAGEIGPVVRDACQVLRCVGGVLDSNN